MDIIFIDTNKYLDYYRVNDESIIFSLEELVKLKDYVFITKQIVDEFHRCKLKEACTTLKKYQEAFNKVEWLPEPWFLGSEKSSKGKRKVIRQDDRKKALKESICSALLRISRGEDEITVALKPVFDGARPHSPEQFQSAKKRKALGNPPGKKTTPLAINFHGFCFSTP